MTWTRRRFLMHSGAALGLAALPTLARPADDPLPDGSATKDLITPEAQQAIDRGLAYLARHQHADGSFGGQHDAYRGNVGITSLAALALMAGGHQPGRGIYGKAVAKALEYVLKQEQLLPDGRGFLHRANGSTHGPMYSHGFGTLFLAEVHGMVHDPDLRTRLRAALGRAVKLILDGQNPEGGWRYQPNSKDADISVTICQIMALRAARNAGFAVPKKTVDNCTVYVRRLQQPDGGFRYMAQHGQSAFARTAAGVVALHCAGVYKGPEVESGLKFLVQHKPSFFRRDMHAMHYFYGHYYAAQAMWTAGGKFWAEWYPYVRDELLNHPDRQRAAGCWTDPRFSEDYGTAMACIVLQIPNNYLPILQK